MHARLSTTDQMCKQKDKWLIELQVIFKDEEKLTPCSPGDEGATEMSWVNVEADQLLEPPLILKDFVKSVRSSRPTISNEDLKRNEEWTNEFGSEGA